jgi:hypothetical protein
MEKLKARIGVIMRFARGNRIVSLAIVVIAIVSGRALATFFTGDIVTRDYSQFTTYEFKQTHGLGFCADTDRPHSAKITRGSDGTLAFTHAVLALAGTDPNNCDDGFAADEGCFHPVDRPERLLTQLETDRVAAVFAQTTYHKRPDQMCREYGIDPCMIERHNWDGAEISDFICANDRLSAEHDTKMRDLLIDLQGGG